MKKWLLRTLLLTAMLCPGAAAIAAVDYKIVTASERGTYIKIGRDLAEFVAPSADVNLDAVPSAGSAENVRRLMFGQAMADANTSYLSNEEALAKLVTDKTLDVVAVVGGQPTKLLVDMKPESRQLIKLLKFDPNHPSSKTALKTYFSATVRASSYPNLLTEDLPGLAVKAFLVTYDFQLKDTSDHLRQMARSLCQNFSTLQEKATRSGARLSWPCRISVAAGSTLRQRRVNSAPVSLASPSCEHRRNHAR